MAEIKIRIDTADEDAYIGTLVFDNILQNWTEVEPEGAAKIFTTKSGNYKSNGLDTELRSGIKRVGICRNFNPNSNTPKHDQGLSDESGRAFNWSR